ncbi:MAG: energy-coupling factor transporter transmembrane protein EcfT [Treponema sp.]|nr:energy-coupling factor transporter transmembrane protein EcfT [Treponema sp.]
MINRPYPAFCLLITFIIIRFIAKIPPPGWKALKNLSLLAFFIILIQTFFGQGDIYIVPPLFNGFVSLTVEGLIFGFMIVCRLFALVVILPVFTETTSPNQIAAGLSSLGFNYKTAFLITTAFNLVPFFKDEAARIMDAQKLRGFYAFDKKNIFSGLKAYSGLLVPLMFDAMRKAQISSAAMDSRAFGIYKTRTWISKPQMKKTDFLPIVFCVIYITCMLFFNYY